MSHFTKIKTRMANKVYLLKALQDLGYVPQDGSVDIRGYLGQRTRVEIRIPTENPEYDIGFRKAGASFECVADWFGLRNVDRETLMDRILQRYAYHAARAELEEQGFTLSSEETQADGRIHLVLRRMT
jgi:hypothetical protein